MTGHCGSEDWDEGGRVPPVPPIPPTPPIPPIPPLAALAALAGAWGGRRRWRHLGGPWGEHGPFGRHGPFGEHGPFGPRGPWGPGGPGGRGGRRGRQFGREELRLLLLKMIAEQPRHGYDLIKAMEERSGGRYSPSPGVIYPALSLLADEGLIAEQDSDDQRRKFAITPAGEAVLTEEAEEAARVMERLTSLGEHAERGRAPSIERAAANLFTAVGQRMRDGLTSEEAGDLPHRIAEILDEAAQRIERL
jgi:DNA-binding PadR family transcriptional regulator